MHIKEIEISTVLRPMVLHERPYQLRAKGLTVNNYPETTVEVNVAPHCCQLIQSSTFYNYRSVIDMFQIGA